MFESQVGILRHVVHAHRAPQGTFAQGTSGSLWMIRRTASALQFGGLAPHFQEGFGQALQVILQWAQQAASGLDDVQPHSFQLVALL
jgi:hypothetical protein